MTRMRKKKECVLTNKITWPSCSSFDCYRAMLPREWCWSLHFYFNVPIFSTFDNTNYHDDFNKCKLFARYWPLVRGIHRSPVDSPHNGQLYGGLMFSLISAWTNGWANNRDAVELRRHPAHYDVNVVIKWGITVGSHVLWYTSERSFSVWQLSTALSTDLIVQFHKRTSVWCCSSLIHYLNRSPSTLHQRALTSGYQIIFAYMLPCIFWHFQHWFNQNYLKYKVILMKIKTLNRLNVDTSKIIPRYGPQHVNLLWKLATNVTLSIIYRHPFFVVRYVKCGILRDVICICMGYLSMFETQFFTDIVPRDLLVRQRVVSA